MRLADISIEEMFSAMGLGTDEERARLRALADLAGQPAPAPPAITIEVTSSTAVDEPTAVRELDAELA